MGIYVRETFFFSDRFHTTKLAWCLTIGCFVQFCLQYLWDCKHFTNLARQADRRDFKSKFLRIHLEKLHSESFSAGQRRTWSVWLWLLKKKRKLLLACKQIATTSPKARQKYFFIKRRVKNCIKNFSVLLTGSGQSLVKDRGTNVDPHTKAWRCYQLAHLSAKKSDWPA